MPGPFEGAVGAAPGSGDMPSGVWAPASPQGSPGAQAFTRWMGSVKRRPDGLWTVPGIAPIDDAAMSRMIEQQRQDWGLSTDEVGDLLGKAGYSFARNTSTGGWTLTPSGPSGRDPAPPYSPPAPGTPGSGDTRGTGGPTFPGGPGMGSPGSPGRHGTQLDGNPGWPGQPPSKTGGRTGAFTDTFGGGGGGFDPSAPLGLDPSKFSGSPVGGNPIFRSGTFPSAGDPFAQIGPNSSARDVAMALAKKQLANQQASLGIYGGLYDQYQTDPTMQGARGLAGQLAADPFSLSDQTLSRIAGQGIDAIGQRAGRLEAAAAGRSAAAGMGRSGGAEDARYRIQANAANQAGNLERNLAVEQATRRPQELASALGAVGSFGGQDAAARRDIGMGAADRVLGQTSILGDALLAGPLLSGQAPGIQVGFGTQYPGIPGAGQR